MNLIIKKVLGTLMLFSAVLVVGQNQFKADTESSVVNWKGSKPTGEHYGTVKVKSGFFTVENKNIIAGEFEIDMNSIVDLDMPADSESNAKLVGHLKSDDFFGVEKNPTAALIFTKVEQNGKNAYKVNGDLTIKGITKQIVFDFSVYGNKATTSLKVDRTKYDVRYGSTSFFDNLKDKAIYDEFDLIADLEF